MTAEFYYRNVGRKITEIKVELELIEPYVVNFYVQYLTELNFEIAAILFCRDENNYMIAFCCIRKTSLSVSNSYLLESCV